MPVDMVPRLHNNMTQCIMLPPGYEDSVAGKQCGLLADRRVN